MRPVELALRRRDAGVCGGRVVIEELVDLLQRLLVLLEELEVVDGRGDLHCAWTLEGGDAEAAACGDQQKGQGTGKRWAEVATGIEEQAGFELFEPAGGGRGLQLAQADRQLLVEVRRDLGACQASSRESVAWSEASWCAQTAQAAMWARAASFAGAAGSSKRLGRAAWQSLQFIVLLPFLRRRVVWLRCASCGML